MDKVKTTLLTCSIKNKVFWFEELILEQPTFDSCRNLAEVTDPGVDGGALEPQLAVAVGVDAEASLPQGHKLA